MGKQSGARHLARVLGITLVAIAHAWAATFTVNARVDSVDASPADGGCDADTGRAGDQCTLRAAIQQANASPGPDVVMLPAGTYKIRLRGAKENGAVAGDLDLADEITISGAGPATTIIVGRDDRVFDVFGIATVEGVTIRKGRAPAGESGGCIRTVGALTLTGSVIARCSGADGGGGIDVRGGFVALRDVAVSRNASSAAGGGIAVHGGTVDLTRVVIQNNWARREGGGLSNSGAIVALTQSRVVDNRAKAGGGGIANEDGGTVALDGCLVSANRALVGGGISTATAEHGLNTTTVKDTIIAKNRPTDCAGPLTSLGGSVGNDHTCGF